VVSRASDAMQALMRASEATGFAMFECRECAHRFYPPQSFCPACLAPDVEPLPDSGEATVLSTIRIHRSLDPGLAAQLPMFVACVKTGGGPSIFTMADRMWNAGARVRIRLRDGLFHAEPLIQ
jgi:uncharacterized OB-fold protein